MALTNLDLILPNLGSLPGGLIAENRYPYPSFELPSGAVTVRENLCINPNFETNAANWIDYGSTSTQSTAFFHSGSASLLVAPSIDSGGVRHQAALTGGVTYTWSAWVYVDGAPKNLRVAAIGTVVASGPTVLVPANTWMRLSVTFAPTATAPHDLYVFGADSTTPFYVDDVLLEASPTVNSYFDGNTPDAGGFEYAWSGAENESTSIMRAKGILGVSDSGVYQSQEWAAEGEHSASVPTGKTLIVALAEPSTVKVVARNIGQTMTVGGNAVTSVAADETLDAYGDTSVVLGPGWWDMLTIVPGVYTGPPFTGSSDYFGYTTAWTGTADASTSTLTLAPLASPLGDIVSWSITEPTTPHNIHTRNGSTGTASITAKATTDTFWTISEDATITVNGLEGSFEGTIDSTRIQPFNEHGDPSGATTFSVASVLNLLNAERTLPPVINAPLSEIVQQYVSAVTSNLTVTWLATTDPTRTYTAWSGNVWDILKTVCAANKMEMALSGSTMIVRDLGTRVIRFDNPSHPGFDIENVSLSVTPGSGQFVEIIYRNSKAIDNQATYNYVTNPSVEVNADGYGVRTLAFGSIEGSRVTN